MKFVISSLALVLAAFVRASDMPEGWRTVVDGVAADKSADAFAANVTRCVWAGDKPGIEAAMPANAAFQFAVTGSLENVRRATDILDKTCKALPPELHAALKACKLLPSTLQWMVRMTRHSSTNQAAYLKAANHTAVFGEDDFKLGNLTNLACSLTSRNIPATTALTLEDEMFRTLPAVPTVPGVDYPGTMPEVTYKTPFGIGFVLRDPHCLRRFRIRAKTWPVATDKAEFLWIVVGKGVRATHWKSWTDLGRGYGLLLVDRSAMKSGSRTDVLVFSRFGKGAWGAPSVVSFYNSPYELRTYGKTRETSKIQYLPTLKDAPPYDLSPICLPAEWTDYYQYDGQRQILGFKRVTPLNPIGEDFSYLGEKILEHHPNDTPKVAQRVDYVVKDGLLRCEEHGEPVTYRLANPTPRNRGE